jgi:hypothetical protein
MAMVLTVCATAQTLVTGDVTGTVSDPSGGVIPNANVTLKNLGTGQSQSTNTSSVGAFRFSFLPPGHYSVNIVASGFQPLERAITVVVGQASSINVQLAVGSASTTVEVTAEAGVLQTENGNISTTFSPQQVELVPNPGNDLSYILQTAPGAVMNTQAGFGNSSTYGLPATSNLFTYNGMNENDPFLNLNNSGATNLLLGQNDIQEATVVNNGYSVQYGGLAGANVNYDSKPGTNKFHGNANYYWNGRTMNANNWFNNDQVPAVPRPFVNANQWSASVGGPIVHDKTFFFVDYEGLRVVLPTNTPTNIPSPQFQAATLANIAASQPTQLPFYKQMFSIWANAPGAAGAQNILPAGGCDGTVSLPGGAPCALQFRSTAGNFTHEWLLTARMDQNIGTADHVYGHFRTDHGVQATYTDPLNSVFNAQSNQPQYEGQLNWSHTFSGNEVNQFILGGSWYSAIFAPASLSAATALMPYRLRFSGGTFYDLGHFLNDWPQGRNVTQYQIIDDFSKVHGHHTLKFGVNFRRNDVTDYNPGIFTTGEVVGEDQASFFGGTAGVFTQAFNQRATQPVALYSLGLYGQDEFKVTPSFNLTIGLRAEHDSNPVCQTNCFARLNGNFLDISHDIAQPYNQAIRTGLHQALPSYTRIAWEPRLGFAWTPRGSGTDTVLRGGIGIFNDFFPATVADNFLNNSPLYNQFFVGPGALAPVAPGNILSQASGANAAFVNGFASGGTFNSISLSSPFFVPPSVFNSASTIHAPQFQEWNLQLQQGIGDKTSVSINYVGNHQIFGPIQNAGLNAYCNVAPIVPPNPLNSAATPCATALGITTGFRGLPLNPIDPRFGTVTEISSSNLANYNGVTLSVQRRFSALQFQANYTYSHALDMISNGGILPFNFATNENTSNPQDPFNVRKYNYGNADYDVRQYASLNYVWTTPQMKGWVGLVGSWTVSGTLFFRTGLPITAIDDNATSTLSGFNYGTTNGDPFFANYLGSGPVVCTRAALSNPCLVAGPQFTGLASPSGTAINAFGNQRRNQVWGPHYFDTDLTVMKNFHVPINEASNIGVGVQFFNLLNHANFDQPVANVSDPQFGKIINTVSVPTSIVGSFLGGDASPRMIQLKGTFTF